MPTIFFNHFRGFERTFLDLKEINFFVGENSTGKTSILKLIGILASQAFWRYGEFGAAETNLGAFEDIVTTAKPAKEFFEIGVHEHSQANLVDQFYIKMRFIENNKTPFLKEVCYQNSTVNIQAIVEGRIVKYRHTFTESPMPLKNSFGEWLTDNGLNDSAFSRDDIQYMGVVPILTQVANHILRDNAISEQKKVDTSAFDIQLPDFADQLSWIAPNRADPLPIYRDEGLIRSSDGTHSFSVLREIQKNAKVVDILNKFGADSGLFEQVKTRNLFDLKALESIKNIKSVEAIKERMGQSDFFELLVTINGESRNIVNVGYGVSQVLPIVIEALALPNHTWFAAQSPEIHLHPRAQAALGDFFFKTNHIDFQKFIIETHSDFIIDRYRLRLNRAFREKEKEVKTGQVVFFAKTAHGNKLVSLIFNEDGSYPDDQPKEFRNFFIREKLDIISI